MSLREIFLLFLFICLIVISHASAQITNQIQLPYTKNFVLSGNEVGLSSDHISPPLDIEYQITTKMVTDKKYIPPDYGTAEGTYKNVTHPSDEAWFTIMIKNTDTSAILFEDGFGGKYPKNTLERKNVIKNKGPYEIDLSGNDVTIDISINAPNPDPIQTTPTFSKKTQISPSKTQDVSHNNSSDSNNSSSHNISIPLLILSLIFALVLFAVIEYFFILKKDKKTK